MDEFMYRLSRPDAAGWINLQEPFTSDDTLLIGIDWEGNIHSLKAALAPAMKQDLIDDWSLTEVGTCLTAVFTYEDEEGDFIDTADARYRFQNEQMGIGCLRWPALRDTHATMTGLWVDLARERQDRDRLVDRLQRALPGGVSRMWHGRSSILLAYHSNHAFRQASPMGLNEQVRSMLAENEVEFWMTFQIGNWSVGGRVENMNQMADFIWKQRPRRRGKSRAA